MSRPHLFRVRACPSLRGRISRRRRRDVLPASGPTSVARRAAPVAALSLVLAVHVGSAGPAQAAEKCSTPTVSLPVKVCLELPPPFAGVITVRARTVGTLPGNFERLAFSTVNLATGESTFAFGDHYPDPQGWYSMRFDTRRFPNAVLRLRARAEGASATGATFGLSAFVTVDQAVSNSAGAPERPPFSPHTPTPSGERFQLAAVGDGVNGSAASQAVVARIAQPSPPDALAYLGDVYDRGTYHEFETHYSTEAEPAGWGVLAPLTNPTIGNHEYLTPNADGAPYWDYWGMRWQPPGSERVEPRHYYSYDAGGWHVVVLDSSTDYGTLDGHGENYQLQPGSPQYEWLKADLAANAEAHPGGCTLAYAHHPFFSNILHADQVNDPGYIGRDGLSQVWRLLSDAGVTALLGGHAHNYERWQPMGPEPDLDGAPVTEGMTQFVVGTGSRDREGTPVLGLPGVEQTYQQPGALSLGLGSRDVTYRFSSIDGSVPDSGTLQCRTRPVVDAQLLPADPDGSHGWYRGAVTLHWDVEEAESPGSLVTEGCEDVTIDTDQQLTEYTCRATSNGGVTERSVQVQRDGTAPVYMATVTPPVPDGANGWYVSSPTVTFSCDPDETSGIAECPAGPVEVAEGESTLQRTAADQAGNQTTVTLPFKVDLTDPTVTCDGTPTFELNDAAAALSATVADAGSGPARARETVSVTTAEVGWHQALVTGTDLAGRTTTTSCDYNVVYDFRGFFAPVDNPDEVNVVRAGRTVPVKWRLLDAAGAPVTRLPSAEITTVAHRCDSTAGEDPIEELVTGDSGLQYLGDGYYQLNWKIKSAYAGSCRTMRLDVGESGLLHEAEFRFAT